MTELTKSRYIAVDLQWRVGDLPAERCEHSQHDSKPQWHEDGGEHYVVMLPAPCGHGGHGDIMVLCHKWLKVSDTVACRECGAEYKLSEYIHDLGPVSNFHKVP